MSPNGQILVTVIVCTWNRADMLADCLQSLADQTMSVDRYEVLVVENACTDHTGSVSERFVRAYPNVRSVREPRRGKSRASNTGLRHARGIYVAFIDDDARAPRSWVERVARAFQETVPTPAVVAGSVTPTYDRRPPAWWELVTGQAVGMPGFLKARWDLYRVCGSNAAFDKAVLLDCGGFAEEHGPVGERFRLGEDTEAVLRVAARYPHVWYDPGITVEHRVPAVKTTLGYLVRRRYLSGTATSQIEKTVLLSRRTRAAILARVNRFFMARVEASPAPGPAEEAGSVSRPPGAAQSFPVLMIQLALWLAEKAGRARGARLFG